MIGSQVLVGVDGSDEARDAVLLGRRIGVASGGALHLVAATDDPLADVVATRLRLDVEALHARLVEDEKRRIAAGLCDLFARDDLARILSVRFGRPEFVLAESCAELDADLVVLGGRPHAPPASWFRRGTAHHLLRVLERPILIAGPNGSQVDRMLVAVDLSFAAEPTIQIAAELAELLGVGLEALHVASRPRLPSDWQQELDIEKLADNEQDAGRSLWSLLPSGTPHRTLEGEPAETIRQAALQDPATLLVLGAQGRGRSHPLLLGSTTETLLAALPSSLAIVPCREPIGDVSPEER